jgi:hypothetical protein
MKAVPSNPEVLLGELIALCPEFAQTWSKEAYLWTDEQGNPRSPCAVFSPFSHYIADQLLQRKQTGLQMVFDFAEQCMLGNEEISTAAATCFLENLINITPHQIDPATFIPFLGPESRAYCRAWDEFCGLKTEGLW